MTYLKETTLDGSAPSWMSRAAKLAAGVEPTRPAGRRDHHNVYVVLLRDQARSEDPWGVYVGLTGLTPEQRLAKHKAGQKASRAVMKHGVRLAPELYSHLNPMSYEDAVAMERRLHQELKSLVPWAEGGH
jgi:hypothetical protein